MEISSVNSISRKLIVPSKDDVKKDIYDLDLDCQAVISQEDKSGNPIAHVTEGRACSATCASCNVTCGNCASVQRVCKGEFNINGDYKI